MTRQSNARILVLNAGSSSLKFHLFDADGAILIHGAVNEVGPKATLVVNGEAIPTGPLLNHSVAFAAITDALATQPDRNLTPDLIGHRIVHGGNRISGTLRLNDDILAEIERFNPLAPLHNPPALAVVSAVRQHLPDVPQYACFDTAFHRTIPPVARRYAIPERAETKGVERYGFHGISYDSLTHRLPEISGAPLPQRLLAMHLGNGASLCAILDGQSVDTTMGFSPLEGLTMGTRSGNIDPNAVLHIAAQIGLEETGTLLNKSSGLLGLAGASNMVELLHRSDQKAKFAVDHFCYWISRHAGAMITAMGGCDAIAFTGGIGENSAEIRTRIVAQLGFVGAYIAEASNNTNATTIHDNVRSIPIYIVPAKEDAWIAASIRTLI